MAFADDIATKIIALSLGTAVGTDIFLGSTAAIPGFKSSNLSVGPYISLIDTGGTGALRTHGTKYPRPTLQVVVRAASAVLAKAKAVALHEALDGLYNVTINSTFYLEITAVQDVMDMQKDETGARSRFGFNLNFISRQQ